MALTKILLATDGSEDAALEARAASNLSAHPVLVARGGNGAWPPRRVVIGDDGSDGALRAGGLAAEIGHLFGPLAAPSWSTRRPREPPLRDPRLW